MLDGWDEWQAPLPCSRLDRGRDEFPAHSLQLLADVQFACTDVYITPAQAEGLSAFRNRSELVQLIEPLRLVPDEVLQQVRAEWQKLSLHGIRHAVQAGRQHVREAVRLAREGAHLDDREVAWLAVAMQHIAVRDDAWAHMEPAQRFAHQSFWIDVVQRTPDGLIAAPGSLLAFVAWQCGNGALANIALSRVGRADASYSMAGLIFQALQSGMPPSAATPPMTPDEVAASYEETLRDF